MTAKKGTPVRFSLLTVIVWLLVAAGIIFLLWQAINRISATELPLRPSSPNQTQVQQTIAAVLTAQPSSPTAAVTISATTSPTLVSTKTPSNPFPSAGGTSTATGRTGSATPLVLCNQAAAGNPIDVTIPDDSLVAPGQSFVKTWKLVNAGTCTWTTAYSASFFYGERMSAPESVSLQENVPPANNTEVSVEMVAPLSPGTYQSNWKLADSAGDLFGIGPNGDSPFWVRIIVAESLTATTSPTIGPTATSTSTGASTPTPTPEGQVSGELRPLPGDNLDLDTLTLNSGGIDLAYQVDADEYHWLSPAGQAKLGVYSSQKPALADCKAANMSPAPIAVESLPLGTYLCYHTGIGRYGRMLLKALDPNDYTLTLELLTWASP